MTPSKISRTGLTATPRLSCLERLNVVGLTRSPPKGLTSAAVGHSSLSILTMSFQCRLDSTHMYLPSAVSFSIAATWIAAQSRTSTQLIESFLQSFIAVPLRTARSHPFTWLIPGPSIGPTTPVGQTATKRNFLSAGSLLTYSLHSLSCNVLVAPYQFPFALWVSGSDQCISLLTSGSGTGAIADVDDVRTKVLTVPAATLASRMACVDAIAGSRICSLVPPKMKGVAVWNTPSHPAIGSLKSAVERSAAKSSRFSDAPGSRFKCPTFSSLDGSRTVPRTLYPFSRHCATMCDAMKPEAPVTSTVKGMVVFDSVAATALLRARPDCARRALRRRLQAQPLCSPRVDQ
mmetsp:Transcript_2899/g.6896  ORF Transcript_2899/g.6896 Transcript_2899/m.6896 type:complete len:347 (+) Transcript_2899:176-1216(+)